MDLQDRVMSYDEVKAVVGRTSRSAVIRYLNSHKIDWRPNANGDPVVSLSAWNKAFTPVTTTSTNYANVRWDRHAHDFG